jgi:hypothetical protein
VRVPGVASPSEAAPTVTARALPPVTPQLVVSTPRVQPVVVPAGIVTPPLVVPVTPTPAPADAATPVAPAVDPARPAPATAFPAHPTWEATPSVEATRRLSAAGKALHEEKTQVRPAASRADTDQRRSMVLNPSRDAEYRQAGRRGAAIVIGATLSVIALAVLLTVMLR